MVSLFLKFLKIICDKLLCLLQITQAFSIFTMCFMLNLLKFHIFEGYLSIPYSLLYSAA